MLAQREEEYLGISTHLQIKNLKQEKLDRCVCTEELHMEGALAL